MKKNSIVAVLIIYLVAILVVGFLGMEMKVYDPTIYTTSIEWDSKELEKTYKITKYTSEEKEEQNKDYDARLVYRSYDSIADGLKINIKCRALPLDATNTELTYYMNLEDDAFTYTIKGDNTIDIVFYKTCYPKLIVNSTDGSNISYTIDFIIIDYTNM